MYKWGFNTEALVASAGGGEETPWPINPPSEWFTEFTPEGGRPHPVRVSPEGRVYGYVAVWGNIHIGYLDRTVGVPHSNCNYAKFRTGEVLTAEGHTIPTGRLVMDTVHPKTKGISASQAMAFYDHTGAAVADVAVYEDELGIQIAGALRPDVNASKVRVLRGSDVSPDWRPFDGQLEMVALLAVNTSGFIVDGLVASAGEMNVSPEDFVTPGHSYIELDPVSGEIEVILGGNISEALEAARATDIERLASLEERLSALEEDLREARLAAITGGLDLTEPSE